jgi:hypothetical protein
VLEFLVPLYFFDIADAHPPIPCEGVHLATIAAARCYALKYSGQILCDQPLSFWDDDEWVMTVSDQNHLTLFTVTVGTLNAPSTARTVLPVYGSPIPG